MGNGLFDAAEAWWTNDKLCFGVSCIGVFFDGIGLCTNVVPGFNATSLITSPMSICCKSFVYKCKQSPNNPFCIKL
uniref:hypothetical protein n=1 Tax=Merotricha bacillata TaxID=658122 RepID=UPI002113C3D4|nr:hypothetical protein NQZ01_pgp139 [Merotricha bacillata]UTE94515.1 hypothetical protein MbacPt_p042 [Merotricha bacillata]